MEANEFNRLLKSLNKEQSSIERLYSFFYPRIVKHIAFRFGEELAKDVAQEFFINLVKNADRQNFILYPTTWVYTCCENIAKRKIYYESRYSSLPDADIKEESDLSFCDLRLDVKEVLQELDSQSREIIRLFYWEGYNQNEIAKIMSLKASTVRQKHSRAIKKLKMILSEE